MFKSKGILIVLVIGLAMLIVNRLGYDKVIKDNQVDGEVSGAQTQVSDDDLLKVMVLDVGQGDSILINTPGNKQILVDGGPNATVLGKLDKYLDFNDKYIDVVVLTHPHADHVTGLNQVLQRYQVSEIWMNGAIHTSSVYLEFLDLIKQLEIPVRIVYICLGDNNQEIGNWKLEIGDAGEWGYGENTRCANEVELGDENLLISFFYPLHNLSGQTIDNLNNSSIVFRLEYGESSFLLTGDAEAKAEQEIIQAIEPELIASQVLKVPHQGATDSSSEEFIEAVNPDYAAISVGAGNQYGHPSLRIIRRYERAGAEVIRTDENGDIVFVSDGKEVITSSE